MSVCVSVCVCVCVRVCVRVCVSVSKGNNTASDEAWRHFRSWLDRFVCYLSCKRWKNGGANGCAEVGHLHFVSFPANDFSEELQERLKRFKAQGRQRS